MEAVAEGPPGCSCGRDVVKYVCVKEDCANFKTQSEYCYKCLTEFKKHMHQAEEITTAKMIREIETRWKELEANYTQLFDAAREKVKPYKNLIGYLDEISKESD